MSNVEIKQTLTAWALIELQEDCGQTLELLIWGEPEGDPERFKLTSPIQRIEHEVVEESALVYTANSVYRVLGPGQHLRLPLAAAPMLRGGYSPDEVTRFYRPVVHSGRPKDKHKKRKPLGPLLPDGLGTK